MKRNCPKCDRELIYKLRKDLSNPREVFELAIKNNTLCRSCMSPRMLGKKHSKESREKIRRATVGKNNPMYGKRHSLKTKRLIKEKRKLQPPMSKEGRKRVSEANKGKKLSKEHIEILRKLSRERKCTQETKKKMRKSRREYFENMTESEYNEYCKKRRLISIASWKKKHEVFPNYNKSAIPLIEQKARELGITDLQHAENGGEFYIEELGYWVDEYSKDKNVVIEYYELAHKYTKEQDERRKLEIVDNLECQFIVINQ